MAKKFIIKGGIFTDVDFKEIIPGTEEQYGPFNTRDEATKEWLGRMFAKVDICPHRLYILETD